MFYIKKLKKNISIIIALAVCAGNAAAASDIFVGSNSNSNAPTGNLDVAANWLSGILPKTSAGTTGLMLNTSGSVSFNSNVMRDLSILQIGGTVGYAGDFWFSSDVNGGAQYIIDDSRTDYTSYTNLLIEGVLKFWTGQAPSYELTILSGHVEAEGFSDTSPGKGLINMRDGIFRIGSGTSDSYLNMMAGGTGNVIFDQIGNNFYHINFEDGSRTSVTFVQKNVGSGPESVVGRFKWYVENTDWITIDGAVIHDISDFIIIPEGTLGETIRLNPYRNYPKFIGQNNNPADPVGALVLDANWEGGVQPVGSVTGLFSRGSAWLGPMQDLAVIQTGGKVSSAGDFPIRGGSTNTSATSLYIIDDPNENYTSYTNLSVAGEMTFWSQYGNPMELSILYGHAEVGVLKAISYADGASKATINMQDGLLHAGLLDGGTTNQNRGYFEVNINMLTGGGGEMIFDALNCTQAVSYLTQKFTVNFETGNAGSITFGSKRTASGTESASGIWSEMIANGQVSIDGIVETKTYMFDIVQDGNSSTITLGDGVVSPTEAYSFWIAGYGVSNSDMTADPDGDQYDNLLEYAFGGNPADEGDQGNAPVTSMMDEAGTNWFYYVHYEHADKGLRGLDYSVAAGTDLVSTNWSGAAVDFVGSGAGPAGFNSITNRIPTDTEGKQFIKLDVDFTE